jgi:hypothetical protein
MLGLAGMSGSAQSAPPKSVTMQDLTVPKDRLPAGCSLKVIEPRRTQVLSASRAPGVVTTTAQVNPPTPSMQPARITANPWMGTDRHVLAELRRGVDGHGALRLPDAPPLTNSEAAVMVLQSADGVEEGYAATYAQSGNRDIGVWAVKFAQTPEMRLDFPGDTHSLRTATIITTGSIRAALFGDGGACSAAIETYLRSLGK